MLAEAIREMLSAWRRIPAVGSEVMEELPTSKPDSVILDIKENKS